MNEITGSQSPITNTEISGSVIDCALVEQENIKVQKQSGYFLRENKFKDIIGIYYKIMRLLDKVSANRRINILKMLDAIGMKFFTAPASSRIDYHSCFPGGLARHSLYTLKNVIKLIDTFQIRDYDKDSVILVSLFHDIGKVGTEDEDYYTVQDDSYWKRRGYLYKINEKLSKTPINILSLHLLQKYQVSISFKEYEAIYSLLAKGYSFREDYNLTAMLQWADMWSVMEEKKEIIDVTSDSESEKKIDNKVRDHVTENDPTDTFFEDGKINVDEVSLALEENAKNQNS
jgi:hypothetical protein